MNHLKLSLLIFDAIAVLGLAIWSIRTFVIQKNKTKLEELNGIVRKVSTDKLKKFAEEQGDEASGDVYLMSKVTTSVLPTIKITEGDVRYAIEFLANSFESEDDKKKVREVDVDKVRAVANDKVTKVVVKVAKEIVKELTMKAVEEEMEKVCYKVVKSVTPKDAKKIKNGSRIHGKAARALEKVFGMKEFNAVKDKVESKAKVDLVHAKESIKNDIIKEAIWEMAKETFVE